MNYLCEIGKVYRLTRCKEQTTQPWRPRSRNIMKLSAGMERLRVESRWLETSITYPCAALKISYTGNDRVEHICECSRHRMSERRWWTPLFWLPARRSGLTRPKQRRHNHTHCRTWVPPVRLWWTVNPCPCIQSACQDPLTQVWNNSFLSVSSKTYPFLSFLSFNYHYLAPHRFKAPKDKGPKNVRIFMNQPTTIDFDKADGMTSTQVEFQKVWNKCELFSLQDIALTQTQLESGELIPLKFVKFQNVQNLQLFIRYSAEWKFILTTFVSGTIKKVRKLLWWINFIS